MGNIFFPYLYLCFSHRTSTSSATRLLSSTWVALTTMQRKRTDNHPSIFLLWGPQTKPSEPTERRREINVNIEPFPGARFKFCTNEDKKQQKQQQENLCLTASQQEFPWGAAGCGDYPCVIHILTSVFQCEGRIIHVCCGQLSPIWTSEIQMASEQELWYSMCIKQTNKQKKILKKLNKKNTRAWIFAAP